MCWVKQRAQEGNDGRLALWCHRPAIEVCTVQLDAHHEIPAYAPPRCESNAFPVFDSLDQDSPQLTQPSGLLSVVSWNNKKRARAIAGASPFPLWIWQCFHCRFLKMPHLTVASSGNTLGKRPVRPAKLPSRQEQWRAGAPHAEDKEYQYGMIESVQREPGLTRPALFRNPPPRPRDRQRS